MSIAQRFATAYEAALTHEMDLPTIPGMMVRVRELGPADCLPYHGLLSAVLATIQAKPGARSDVLATAEDIALLQRAACASVVGGSEPPAEGAERVWEPMRVVAGDAAPGELPVGLLTRDDLIHIWTRAIGAGRRAADSAASFRGPERRVERGVHDGGGDGPPGPLPAVAAAVDG